MVGSWLLLEGISALVCVVWCSGLKVTVDWRGGAMRLDSEVVLVPVMEEFTVLLASVCHADSVVEVGQDVAEGEVLRSFWAYIFRVADCGIEVSYGRVDLVSKLHCAHSCTCECTEY